MIRKIQKMQKMTLKNQECNCIAVSMFLSRGEKFISSYPYTTLATNSYFKALDNLAFLASILWMSEGCTAVCNSSRASYVFHLI